MLAVPRIFGNQSTDGPSLEDWLGYMTTSLDDMAWLERHQKTIH
jgi:hypothetical protein